MLPGNLRRFFNAAYEAGRRDALGALLIFRQEARRAVWLAGLMAALECT